MFVGAGKRRDAWYELGLFVAWHVAVFNAQAKSGKLQDWATMRAKLRPKTEAPVAQDWRVRKSERQAQMASLKKHQEMRKRPMKKAHGR